MEKRRTRKRPIIYGMILAHDRKGNHYIVCEDQACYRLLVMELWEANLFFTGTVLAEDNAPGYIT